MSNPQRRRRANLELVTDAFTPFEVEAADAPRRSARKKQATRKKQWRANVMRRAIAPSLGYFLLGLYDTMDDDGFSEITQEEIADQMGISDRLVRTRYKAAVEGGWLSKVKPGGRGGAAVYYAEIPTFAQARDQHRPAANM